MNNNPILPNGQDFSEPQLDALDKIQKRAVEELNNLKKSISASDPNFPHSAEHLTGFMGQALTTIRAYKKKFPKTQPAQQVVGKADEVEVEKDAYRES